MLDKERLLVVNKAYDLNTSRGPGDIVERLAYADYNIVKKLGRNYNIHRLFNLDVSVLDFFKDARAKGIIFPRILTHVPYQKGVFGRGLEGEALYTALYTPSLEVLRAIKREEPRTRVVAYSGVDDNPIVRALFLEGENAPVDRIVFKTSDPDWVTDCRKIEEALLGI